LSPVTYNLVSNEEGRVVTIYGLPSGIKVIRDDALYFEDVVQELVLTSDNPDADVLERLIAPAEQIALRFQPLTDRVTVRNNRLYYDGDEINDGLADQVLAFLAEDEDFWPLVNFYERLMSNPIPHSREQAYRWLKSQRLTITEDGMVIGYKGCVSRDDDMQRESTSAGSAIVNNEPVQGRIPYPDGATVTMPRSNVQHDPSASCSTGLHVGTYSYAKGFGNHVIEVLVDPRDIVSVPDGEDQKMRVCRLVVLGPSNGKIDSLVRTEYDEDEEYYHEDGEESQEPTDVDTPYPVVPVFPAEISYPPLPDEPPRTGATPTQDQFDHAVIRAKRRRQNLPKWISNVLKWTLVKGDGKNRKDWRL
jgi:hypothetical protein